MGTVITTALTNFDKTVITLVNKRLEELLRAPLPHLLPGNFREANFVKGSNSTMRFINIADMSVVAGTVSAGTPPWLTEGSPPTTEDLAIGYEEFTASQAGRVIKLTDVAMMESPFELLSEAADRVARNAIATADKRVAEVLSAGAQVTYAGGASSRALIPSGSALTGALVKLTVARLKAASVPTFSDGTYRAIVHPGSTYDLESDTAVGGWIDAQRYAGSAALFTGEVGRYAGVRFIESPAAVGFAGIEGVALAMAGNAAIATTDVITCSSAHGLVVGNRMKIKSLTGGTGLTDEAVYFVVSPVTSTTFKVSATLNGAAIDITADSSAITAVQYNDILNAVIFGPEAYAFGDWGSIQTYFTQPGGTTDPLHQLSQVGWKGMFGAVIMGEGASATGVTPARYRRIEHTSQL
jgi:N4-gp56 family major capsid protein